MSSMDYKFNKNERFFDIANNNHTTVDAIMRMNSISPPFPTYVNQLPESTLKSLNGSLKLPCVTTGGDSYESYQNTAKNVTGIIYKSAKDLVSISNILSSDITLRTSGVSIQSNLTPGYTKKDCYIKIHRAGKVSTFWFPCYPESVSDQNSASYTPQNILGRSEPFQYYTGSGPRTVNVSFEMHCEMCGDIDYVYKLVDNIESACYPNYGSAVAATKVTFHVANNITIRGIIPNVSTEYSGPILDTVQDPYSSAEYPRYAVVKLSFSVTEVTGSAFSSSDIASFGGRR